MSLLAASTRALALVGVCMTVVACGQSGNGAQPSGTAPRAGDSSDATAPGTTGPDAAANAGDSAASSPPTSGDGSAPTGALFGGHFRHGMNSGHVNPNFTDNQDGLLGTLAGADSNRIKLPQYF